MVSYMGDTALKTLHRIEAVRVKAAGSLVRKYVVDYETNANDPLNQSRVESIGLCFNEQETDCAEEAQFTWPSYPASPVTADQSATDLNELWFNGGQFSLTGDVNGDGLTDMVVRGDTVNVKINNGDGTYQALDTWITQAEMDSISLYRSHKLMDINSDGLVDMVIDFRGVNNVFVGLYVFYSDGQDFGAAQAWLLPSGALGSSSPLGYTDFNGDGLMDLYELFTPNKLNVALNHQTSTQSWLDSSLLGDWSTQTRLIDLNNDGLPDIVNDEGFPFTMTTRVGYNTGDGATFTDLSNVISPLSALRPLGSFFDLNGDGLKDFLWRDNDGVHVAINKGGSFTAPECWDHRVSFFCHQWWHIRLLYGYQC